ncbi:MAG: hypothetical protein KBA61_05580 [Spirochaetes bacterium]|nr:hypothetical protein [Spirochaetota bacterium]
MEIQINGHPIEFTLELEKSLDHLVGSISAWARERDLIFTEAWVDDEKHSVDSMPSTPLEKIGVVNCVILSRAELVINSINEATDYCSRIDGFMEKAAASGRVSAKDIDEMKAGVDWLAEVTMKVLSLLGIGLESLKYRDRGATDLFEDLKEFRIELSRVAPGDAAALLGRSRGIFSSFRDLLKIVLLGENMRATVLSSIDSPDTVMAMVDSVNRSLPEQVRNLEEAAIAYQAGRDGEGSSRIEGFIDFVYRYFRMCHQVKPVFDTDISLVTHDGKPLAGKNAEMNELLNQMLAALENNDIIGLADVLEYELKPALESLAPYCREIFSLLHRDK